MPTRAAANGPLWTIIFFAPLKQDCMLVRPTSKSISKVDVPHSVTCLNRTPIFKSYVVRCDFKDGHQKTWCVQKVEDTETNTLSYSIYIWLRVWYKIYTLILAFGLHIRKKENVFSFNWIFYEYSKSKPLASLNWSIGPMYDDLAYDEDPYFIA